MARESFVLDPVTRTLVDRDIYYARKASQVRSTLPMPMFISDHMDAVEHPCTGEMIDSKSRFERTTRAHGCVTMGDDPARLRPMKKTDPDAVSRREALKKAFARQGLI